jgi:hypothetical protein
LDTPAILQADWHNPKAGVKCNACGYSIHDKSITLVVGLWNKIEKYWNN